MRTLLLFLGAATMVMLVSGLAAYAVGRFIAQGHPNDDTDDQDGGAR